ncbi:MAG: hypothetical protein ILP07_03235 [Treponema sp.]|nr:hypothetical protein [Treponema sp.]
MNRKLSKYLISLAAVCALLFIGLHVLKNKSAENIASYENLAAGNTQVEQNEQSPELVILDPETNLEPISETVPEILAETVQEIIAESAPDENPQTENPPDQGIDENGSYTTKDEVALYIHTYGHLPKNYITKRQAEAEGWSSGDAVSSFAPGKSIGGDRFGNYEGLLPKKKGRTYTECDIDAYGRKSRGSRRIVFSNDGLIYYTGDHYKSFELLYGEE